jgi:urea carboxylase
MSTDDLPIGLVVAANRGECAMRIFRTCKRMGIATAAVYTAYDRESRHKDAADQKFEIGSYVDIAEMVNLLTKLRSNAATTIGVHPGWGFLSENAEFAQAVEGMEGIVWIGPSSRSIKALGAKDQARLLAMEAGVPLTKGSPIIDSAEAAVEWACLSGAKYPLIVKPVSGGGGIGMRVCASEEELGSAESWTQMQDIAAKHFGDASSFIEEYIEEGRHLEVQVFGNGKGSVVHLGERDCSVQRRNQKVIEESPAPGISESTRQEVRFSTANPIRAHVLTHPLSSAKLFRHAVNLCQHCGYASAGTVEFIYNSNTEQFYFLEVNTR